MHAGAAQQTAAPAAPAAAAAAAAASDDGDGGSKQPKKKKQKRSHAAASTGDEEEGRNGGIALFSGQPQATEQQHADPAAAFIDHEPHVATGDPFEEANVIRKSHKIKVCGCQGA